MDTQSFSEQLFQIKQQLLKLRNQQTQNTDDLLEVLGQLVSLIKMPSSFDQEKNEALGLMSVVCSYLGKYEAAKRYYEQTIGNNLFVDQNLYCFLGVSYVNLQDYLSSIVALKNEGSDIVLQQRSRTALYLTQSSKTVGQLFSKKYRPSADNPIDEINAFELYFDACLVFDFVLALTEKDVLTGLSLYQSLIGIPWRKIGSGQLDIPDYNPNIFRRFDDKYQGLLALLPKNIPPDDDF